MSHSEEADSGNDYEFKWGKKSGHDQTLKTQFYDSFTYGGVEYFLYDCVYLYKEGQYEPYIGKILKIWDHPVYKKKLKIVWFFRPEEILNWLGDIVPLENEIFLASGDGLGLANINPLEALMGKCNVVCTSEDRRNPQPSEEELQMADHIFYRTFDVGKFTISDRIIADKIAGTEVKNFFNRKKYTRLTRDPEPKGAELKQPKSSGVEKDLVESPISQSKDKAKLKPLKDFHHSGSLENSSYEKIRLGDPAKHSEQQTSNLSPSVKREKESTPTIVRKPRINSVDVKKFSGSHARTSEHEGNVGGSCVRTYEHEGNVGGSHGRTFEHERKVGRSHVRTFEHEGKVAESRVRTSEHEGNVDVKKFFGSHARTSEHEGNVGGSRVRTYEHEGNVGGSHERTSEHERKVGGSHVRTFEHEGKVGGSRVRTSEHEGNVGGSRGVNIESDKDFVGQERRLSSKESMLYHKASPGQERRLSKTEYLKMKEPYSTKKMMKAPGKDFVGHNRGVSSALNLGMKAIKLSDKEVEPAQGKVIKTDSHIVEVTQRPDVDKKKWFKELSWEESMDHAHTKGSLVQFQNLDPSYTSAEIEDLVYSIFKMKCSAKVLQQTALSIPHCGQALVIFKTKEAADMVVAKLRSGCLMLPDGRPLIAKLATPRESQKPTKFVGHLSIDKISFQNKRKQIEAVSTSHYSQPNTIEYELAVEWCLLQKRSEQCLKVLYEEHGNQLDALKVQLKRL